MAAETKLIAQAMQVLEQNRRGDWTCPSRQIYPHQWLWDSCFIAIGLAQYDPGQAAAELRSLFRGQWKNGMLPHVIFNSGTRYRTDAEFWHSHRSPYAPRGVHTSGITQPPVTAIAALKVAQHLPEHQGDEFLAELFPKIAAFHDWLYNERDPGGSGLIVLIHPWESGLDNTPPWMRVLRQARLPFAINLLDRLGLDNLIGFIKSETERISENERITTSEALRTVALAYQYKRKRYNSRRILKKPPLAVESLVFNCILIAANTALAQIADRLSYQLSYKNQGRAERTRRALEELWDPVTGEYYPRDLRTGELIKDSSIMNLLPLFSGAITPERAKLLAKTLKDKKKYGSRYLIPTVPLDAESFDERRYWQGPVWINTDWMIMRGLEQYGYHDEAALVADSIKGLVAKSGFREYFSPLDGTGFGANDFGWTASLYLDTVLEPTKSR